MVIKSWIGFLMGHFKRASKSFFAKFKPIPKITRETLRLCMEIKNILVFFVQPCSRPELHSEKSVFSNKCG